MLKTLLLSFTLALAATATAQNLVPNPSFEDTTNCHLQEGQYEFMLGLARPWFSPNLATPDVFTSDADVACGIDVELENLTPPFDGLRYAGLFMFTNAPDVGGSKDYAGIRLQQELLTGQAYHLTLRVARARFSRYAVASFGAHFSADSIHVPNGARLPVVPQVTFFADGHFESMEWTTVNASFTAMGGERFLYLGSFQEDAEMDCSYDPFFGGEDLGYYNIDQVELVPDDVGLNEALGDRPHAFIHGGVLRHDGEPSANITVFDARGGQVLSPIASTGGWFALPLELSAGCYFVRVDGHGTQVLKWVKE